VIWPRRRVLTHISRSGQPGIKANQKAVQGDLFMLEKYIFFVSKQPTLIELAEVHQVVFSRVGGGLGASAVRTFDLKVVTKAAPEYTFTSINKEEHEGIEAFLRAKKVRVKNEMMADVDMIAAAAALDDDDDEMQSVASDGEEAPRPRVGGNDDDDSEEGALVWM
jgi:structure-specific recognition protein 1